MQVSWLQRCCLIKTRTPTIRNGIFWIYRRFSIMNSRKITIDDIRSRKAEVLREMRAVRADINDSIHSFTHPVSRLGRFASIPVLGNMLSTANKVLVAYKVASSVASFFRRRRR